MKHPNDTIRQALLILRAKGDKRLHGLNRAISPRPSEIIAAMNSHRARAIFVHDDVDGESDTLELLPVEASAEDVAISKLPDDYAELHDALEELTPKQRTVIDCVYWKGLDLRATSDRLSCSYENVRLHHKKALKSLRERL